MSKKRRKAERDSAARQRRFTYKLEQLLRNATSQKQPLGLPPGDIKLAEAVIEGWACTLSVHVRDECDDEKWHFAAHIVPPGRPRCVHDRERISAALEVLGAPVDEVWVRASFALFDPRATHHFVWWRRADGRVEPERLDPAAVAWVQETVRKKMAN